MAEVMVNEKKKRNRFLLRNREKSEFNQYWYSAKTIATIAAEVPADIQTCFMSTPSIYFSLPKEQRKNCYLFDLDDQWKNEPNFFAYNFNKPEDIPIELHGTMDMAIIDPPFITREVWEKYAEAVKLVLKSDGKLLCTTIAENAPIMKEILGVEPNVYKPSIPNLVYQYMLYTNYESENLKQLNPEIP